MGGRGGSRSGGGAGGGGGKNDGEFVMVGPPSVNPAMLPAKKAFDAGAARREAAISQFSKPVDIGKFNTPTGLQNVTLRIEPIGTAGREFDMVARSADGKIAGGISFRVTGDRVQNTYAKVSLERQGLGGQIYERIIAFARAAGARQYVSDSILSYKAAGQWAKMVAKYGGRKNESSFDGHYNHGKQGKPVYEVDLK